MPKSTYRLVITKHFDIKAYVLCFFWSAIIVKIFVNCKIVLQPFFNQFDMLSFMNLKKAEWIVVF